MATSTTTTEAPKKVDLGLLEEDDEFEEFPAEGESLVKHTRPTRYVVIWAFRSGINIFHIPS